MQQYALLPIPNATIKTKSNSPDLIPTLIIRLHYRRNSQFDRTLLHPPPSNPSARRPPETETGQKGYAARAARRTSGPVGDNRRPQTTTTTTRTRRTRGKAPASVSRRSPSIQPSVQFEPASRASHTQTHVYLTQVAVVAVKRTISNAYIHRYDSQLRYYKIIKRELNED